MRLALDLARKAMEQGEAPVGAVIVKDGQVIGRGHNRIYLDNDPVAHAEVLAIRAAAKSTGGWRLLRTTAYVTLEPCIMCAAALTHARVPRLVYGAMDMRWGAVGSLFDFSHDPRMNHEFEVISGVMADEAAEPMQSFFGRFRRSGR